MTRSIFVADNENGVIHVFNVERKHVRTFSQCGMGEGLLDRPRGMDISADGLLYVAHNHCVSVYRIDGTFIRTVGQGKLQCPYDVLVHSSGLVYVADGGNHRITVFSQEGELVHSFGSIGEGKGEFAYPSALATSPDGHHLYVSDQFNHRVQVFTLEGQFVREFGTAQLKYPRGLTVTSDGSVLVADDCNNRIAVFDKKGEHVHSFAVTTPVYLTVDSLGDLLVASCREKCVYEFCF